MENKKQFPDNEGARNEPTDTSMGSLMKHQYNAMPEDYRLMQCGQKPVSYSNYHSVVQQQQQQLVQAPSTWAPISVQQLPHARVQSTDLISFHKQKPASAPVRNSRSAATAQQQQQQQQHHHQQQQQQQLADNKKNSTNYQQLRSPSAKRPAHGTVTMQGWLYKQGSEGLKVWRKRWFVLSDYCLYYYKGPEEEKILGSILLPSYKVSLCTSKDKVYRKFAFKCEHANMRTYYLAAESEQAVMNWIQAVNLACTLQTNAESNHQSNPSISSGCTTLKTNESYHQHQHHHHQQHQQHPHPQYNTFSHPHTPTPTPSVPVPVPVHHVQSHSNMSVASISYDFPCGATGAVQPLYANAPPKPRRIGDGYSTPSPEFFLGDRYHGQCYSPYGMPEERCTPKNNNVYLKNCNNCTGYGTVGGNVYEGGGVTPVHCNHIYEQQVHTPIHRDQNVERRTPDTYGRAKLNSLKMKSDKSDYEDVYADEVIYKRPLSPVAYSNIKKVSPVASISVQHRPYMPVFSSTMPAPDVRISHKTRTPPIQPQPQQPDRIQHNTIPRPHSADFLDYEVKYRNVNKLNTSNCQQPRPKSSLDISRSASDNYYYSKESYAENMRKSAMYMQQIPPQYHYSKENEHVGMVNGHGVYQKRKYLHEPPQGARSMQRGSQDSLDITRSASPYAKSPCHLKDERTYTNHRVESLPRDRDREREREREREIEYHNEQFKRSASARLLRTPQEELYESVNKEGVQKREESMKRLLEWKQRMLQSPLNRKTSLGCSPHMMDRPDLYIRPVAHTHYPHHPQMPQETHRSYANVAMPQYSSYSSDDEENNLNRSKNAKTKSKEGVMHTHTHSRLLQAQAGMAGWTKEDHTDSLTNSPAPATPISASTTATRSTFDTLTLEVIRSNSIQNTSYSRPPSLIDSTSTIASIPTSRTDSMLELASEPKSPVSLILLSRDEKCGSSDIDATFTSTERSFYFENNAIQSPNSVSSNKQRNERSYTPDHSKNNEQLYEDLLVSTPKEITSNIEENYMTMTPKASVLIPFSTHQRQSSSECDEGAYMEMTKGLGVSLLNQDDTSNNSGIKLNGDVQPYEVVCFGDTNKIEPVYMELNNTTYNSKSILINLANKTELTDKNDLPDILMASKNKNMKSDSSDADDEASKDLDSLDAPCHPRFSLSDTFRPASYYLGANRVLTEFHDSSDSELVSPPPIPTSPPPMDDLDHSFFKQDKNMTEGNSSTNVTDYLYSKKNMMGPLSEETVEADDCFRNKYYLSPENLKEQDYISVYSMNSDITKKRVCARSSHNSDSDIELRNCNSLDYVRKLKRRPVSEEFCDELESRFSEMDDSSYIDRYLRDLNVSNSSNVSKDSPDKSKYYSKTKPDCSPRYKNLSMIENIVEKDESPKHKSSTHRHRKSTGNISLDSRRTITGTDTSDNTLLSSPSTVPYYYSDVSTTATESTNETSILFTLNNQRMDMNAGKKHITRIVNPIRPNITDNDNTTKLETRCASADFLNTSSKYSQVDKNKLNESDIIKKEPSNSEGVNVYCDCPNTKHSKLNGINTIRKTHSLEGLLEYVLNDSGTGTATGTGTNTRTSCDEFTDESNNTLLDTTQEGSQIWEEDSLWKERLRNASQRQTRSLDNFDHIFNETKSDKKFTKLNPCAEKECSDSSLIEPELDQENATPKKPTFTIDRETLRQWDLLSSAPSPSVSQTVLSSTVTSSACTVSVASSSVVTSASSNCLSTTDMVKTPVAAVVETDQGYRAGQGTGKNYVCERENAEFDAQHPASGSIYMQHTAHETFPRSMTKKPWTSNTLTPSRSNKLTLPMRPSHSHDFDQSRTSPYFYAQSPIPGTPMHQDDGHRNNVPNATWPWSGRMNMTAGELLGRTHEELVLLLIQLRRQSTNTCHAIETCYSEIDNIQSQLNNMSAAKRSENLQKLEYLKQHLLELEKQYEKGKPLVNLVDNMVKLGSLYRNPNDQYYNTNVKDRLEFNQQIQEQRLLAEERKDWNRFNSNHTQLQSKVQQLYQLDRLLQEESGTLQCLQYDKEKIERALSGLRLQLNKGYKDPVEIEQARKQQIRLENELSRVHFMLAQNSKKLEETVAGNARLEQELLVLRQKLQLSRQHRSSAQFSNTGAGDSLPCAAGTSAMLEAELHRVQQLVGDLQRQRQELSVQVRQLTDRSHSLTQQIQPVASHGSSSSCTTPTHHAIASGKKRITTLWRETDLDTMVSVDHGSGSDWDLGKVTSRPGSTEATSRQEEMQYEEHQQQNIEDIPQEKTEIKTVRIVKRESERRQRDKEKSSSISDSATAQQKWDTVVEEVDDSFNNMYLPSTRNQVNENNDNSSDSHMVDDNNHLLNRLASISSPSLYSQKGSYSADADSSIDDISIDKSPDLSPVFKSEAARQIIIEMSGGVASEPSTLKKCVRRTVPKEKRRHYTAPHNNLLSKSTFEIDNKVSVESRRARDDLDMERALRHRTDTPDVVRSTMNRKELKYNENTIDNILGTPNKINIPERYIPEQLPQLSVEEQRHRLRKVESIKKMLSDTILGSTSSAIKSTENLAGDKMADTTPLQKVTSKMVEEKRQREHLLQLNQILAKQVMEMSKIVAVKALATLPLQPQKMSLEEDDLSPVTPLPLYQQRDNFYS